MREIIVDTETTGLDPASGHRIVEIGCVEVFSRVRTGNFFHCYLNPERDMPPEAERVHGLSAAFLRDKPVFSQKVDEFLSFVSDAPLVIHNAGFDMRFINFELERLGFSAIPMTRAIDTVTIARKKFPGSPASLDALCKRFEIDLGARTKHGALLDAELLADVYLELMGGRQVKLALDAEAEMEQANSPSMQTLQREKLAPRAFPADTAELEAHDALVKKLKDALWLKKETV